MPTQTQTINSLAAQHISLLDSQITGFHEGLVEIADGLRNVIQDVVPQLNQTNRTLLLKQTVYLQSQIRGQLTQLGYDDLIDDFISGYDETALYGRQVLEALGRADQILSPLRNDTLLNLKNLDMDAFGEIGDRAVRALSKELTLDTLAGKSRAEVIKSLDQVLEGQFANQGTLYADTALRTFDRTVNGQLWLDAGIYRYRYFGPNDRRTRRFCRALVGRTYQITEIRLMHNGSVNFGDPWRFGGGPRCRHTWTPIVD